MKPRNAGFVSLLILISMLPFMSPDLVLDNLPGWVTTVMAQEDAGDSATAASEGEVNTLWDMIRTGGWIMIPIFLCSVWMLGLMAELFLKLRNKVACPPSTVEEFRAKLEVNDYLSAYELSENTTSILSHVMRRALKKIHKGQDMVEEHAGEALMDENNVYRTKISYLGVVAAISPMLGLLGTISGMIKAFNKMGHEGAIGDPAKLAGDIGEALVTTFTGLCVAIPAMIIFYVMTNRLKKVLTHTQECFTELTENLPYNEIPEDLVLGRDEDGSRMVAAPAAAPAARPAPNVPKAASAGDDRVQCPSCNNTVQEGSPFCASCGTALEWD